MLTPKQMHQRLSIALAEVKASYIPEKILNKIHQIIYFWYQAKQITKKCKAV